MKYVIRMAKITLVSCLCSAVLILLLSVVMLKLDPPHEVIKGCILGIYFLSNLAGGLFAGRFLAGRRFLNGAVAGIVYFVILFLLSILLQSPTARDVSGILTTAVICIGGGMLGGMLSPGRAE